MGASQDSPVAGSGDAGRDAVGDAMESSPARRASSRSPMASAGRETHIDMYHVYAVYNNIRHM